MIIYKKRVSVWDARFGNKEIVIISNGREGCTVIPVPDDVVVCNSCNRNICEDGPEAFGWLIYFDKRSLRLDQPYDVYCESCVKRLFPKAVVVTE